MPRPGAIIPFILGFMLFVQHLSALSCGSCRPSECQARDCEYGFAKDACSCCDICAKGRGEECGGLWDLGGKCAQNLTCTFSPLPEGVNFYFFRTGICLPDDVSVEDNLTY